MFIVRSHDGLKFKAVWPNEPNGFQIPSGLFKVLTNNCQASKIYFILFNLHFKSLKKLYSIL